MDKTWMEQLRVEAADVGIPLEPEALAKLALHIDLLLKWNAKVNLTRITDPEAIRVKHVLDSLLALKLVPSAARRVLDLGAGAGFPGIPWLCVRPDLDLTLVDAVGKKVAFLKAALATLGLPGRALHTHLAGRPEKEGIPLVDLVVSRAFMPLGPLLPLASAYLLPGGAILAMLGPREGEAQARSISASLGFEIKEIQRHDLPEAQGQRWILRVVPRETK